MKSRVGLVLILCSLLFGGNIILAQTIPSVQSQSSFCVDPATAVPISDFVAFAGDGTTIIDGIQISVTTNYENGIDLLNYTNNNGISGIFDSANGLLILSGNQTLDAYRQALTEVTYTTTSSVSTKELTVSLSAADYLPETGHFYKFFPSAGIQWSVANVDAQNTQLLGMNGYLATITTASENQFILDRVSGTAWLGASDDLAEGTWRWVTGPEGLEDGGQGRRLDAGFVNWDVALGEPNDCCGSQTGEENYAHMMDWSNPVGLWNDLPDVGGGGQYAPTGYIVEFGGMPGDPVVAGNLTGTTILELQPEVNLAGAQSVCPNIQGLTYSIESIGGYAYNWTVNGGSIVSGQGTNQVEVNWGTTNATASIKVTMTSNIACIIEEELAVRINEQLEPPAPTGPEFVCFTDLITPQVYTTPLSQGSNYNWQVTNGQVVSGNGTNTVEVLWDGPGTGTLFFTESTTTATDICDGDSPMITIDLREEIIPTFNITHVSCFGGNDAVVEITNVTGQAPFTYTWNTNGLGVVSNNIISSIPAGSYSVDIESNGCSENFTFEVTEPTELMGNITVQNVLCFGGSTGSAEASVDGGTPPYRYVWSNSGANQPTIGGLSAGAYFVDVFDQNDCSIRLDFSITEPPELVLDSIASRLVSCPGGSDGELEAFVSGGTPPYTFTWEANTSTNSLATGFEQGTYQVNITDSNGCTISGSQTVDEATPKIILPTAFSPNGDNVNDVFGPSTACPVEFNMVIYNRWGTVVFTTELANEGWDGTYKGQPVPDGKYTYSASWVIQANDLVIADQASGVLRLFR